MTSSLALQGYLEGTPHREWEEMNTGTQAPENEDILLEEQTNESIRIKLYFLKLIYSQFTDVS